MTRLEQQQEFRDDHIDAKTMERIENLTDEQLYHLSGNMSDVAINTLGLYLLATAGHADMRSYLNNDNCNVSVAGTAKAMRLALESDNEVRYSVFDIIREQVEGEP